MAAVVVRELSVLGCCSLALAVLLALLSQSRSEPRTRVWLAVLLFTGLIAVPAIFITPGDVVYRLPVVGLQPRPGHAKCSVSDFRAETTATLSVLLILTTLWSHLLRALRFFRVPVVVVVCLG